METNSPVPPGLGAVEGDFEEACPTRTVLATIADKWATYVIELLGQEPHRFGALRRAIGGISPKMLTQTLRRLQRDGLVHRAVHATSPPTVEYSITPLGTSLVGPIVTLRTWAEANVSHVLAARAAFDAQESTKATPTAE